MTPTTNHILAVPPRPTGANKVLILSSIVAAVGWLFPLMALMFVVVLNDLPETKGTSLVYLQTRLGTGHSISLHS